MSVADVRDFYDRNTASFLQFGQGGNVGAIHRAVWGPGVSDRSAAFRFVEAEIGKCLHDLPKREGTWRVLDLGCGVGGSLAALASTHSIDGTGITLSPVQAATGRSRLSALGLGHLRVLEGDYTALPSDLPSMQLAYAIESFVHGPRPEAFFAEAARVLEPGGRLVICDDFLSPRAEADELSATERARLDDFRKGWLANSLMSSTRARSLAERAGFELRRNDDWTEYLELNRPRDRAIGIVVGLGRRLPIRHPRWLTLLGGDALQHALTRGVVQYRFMVWERAGHPAS